MTPAALDFIDAAPASRVVLGPGRRRDLAVELHRLGAERVRHPF
jgi:hypothetical protein